MNNKLTAIVRILKGKPVMYRVKMIGTPALSILNNRELFGAECEFHGFEDTAPEEAAKKLRDLVEAECAKKK